MDRSASLRARLPSLYWPTAVQSVVVVHDTL